MAKIAYVVMVGILALLLYPAIAALVAKIYAPILISELERINRQSV